MGFYQEHLLPHLLNLAMKQKEMTTHRRSLLPAASGRVLEVGIGSGLNLPFYSSEVSAVVGVDPSARLVRMAQRAAKDLPFPVKLVTEGAERLPFEAGQFDSVVTTWTLCSIAGAGAALEEMRRVLKPEGALIFIEHGRAPEPAVAAWQARLTPLWGRCAGGCRLDRPIGEMISAAGFAISRLETGYLVRGPRPLTYHFKGRARPR
jgi:ubiquinone/menaquinone biosynthesis C-methylase UbiE